MNCESIECTAAAELGRATCFKVRLTEKFYNNKEYKFCFYYGSLTICLFYDDTISSLL